MKKIKNLSIIAILAMAILFALSIMINAETTNVAKIGDKEYATLDEAVAAVPADGTQTTITLLRDVEEGAGFIAQPNQNFIIDFAGYTYDASLPTVGSAGTETNGCQLLKGSTVTFKNGTLFSTTASIIIQNYCNLTLEDMVIDGTKSTVCSYALSCNCGEVKIIGNTSIYNNQNAFDMCWAPNVGYPEGTQMTVDTTGTISGTIKLDVWGTFSDEVKSTLTLKNLNHIGDFNIDTRLADQLTIEGGTYSTDVSEYIGEEYTQVKVSDSEYEVVTKQEVIEVEIPTVEVGENQVGVAVSETASDTLKEIAANSEEVKQAIEEGKNVSVDIVVEPLAPEMVVEEDKNLITTTIENGNVAQYLDISLLIKIDGTTAGEITEPTQELTFELTIPENLLKENRNFYILRVHDGKVEKIEGTLAGNTFTFSTDKFSTYALAYTDAEVGEIVDDTTTEKDETPKTGAASYIAIIASVLAIATVGLVVVKTRKDIYKK